MDNARTVILAEGEKIRVESEVSKLLHKIGRNAVVGFPAKACKEYGIDDVIVVVSHQAKRIKFVLGENFTYVY